MSTFDENETKNRIKTWYTNEDEKYITSFGEAYEQHFSKTNTEGGACAILTTKHCYLQGEYYDETGEEAKKKQVDKKLPLHNTVKAFGMKHSWDSSIPRLIGIILLMIAVVVIGFFCCELSGSIEWYGSDISKRNHSKKYVTEFVNLYIIDKWSELQEETENFVAQFKINGFETPNVTVESGYYNGSHWIRVVYYSNLLEREIKRK